MRENKLDNLLRKNEDVKKKKLKDLYRGKGKAEDFLVQQMPLFTGFILLLISSW